MKKSTQPIHVVHIIPTLAFGGAERFLLELTKRIPKNVVKQTIITLWDTRPLLPELDPQVECIVIPFDKIGYTRRISHIAKILKDIKADIVHTHLFSADLWGRLAARRAGIPVVTTVHNVQSYEPLLWKYIQRGMKNYSRIYTAPSRAIVEFMHTSYGIDISRAKVILYGIDLTRFIKIPKPSFKPPYRLGMVGRIVEQKGHRFALDAMKELSNIPCTLTITGDGEKKAELQAYAEKIGVANRVEWKAPQTDVSQVYQDLDIFLMPSLWEGLGIVILEAMASERCVIASHVDGIPEIVSPGETGVLVPARDPHALALAVRDCIAHAKESLERAARGRVWAQEHAGAEHMAREYTEMYTEIMQG